MRILSLPVFAEIENVYNNWVNAAARSAVQGKKTILYVVKNLATHGGVETRLHAYASCLKSIGYDVLFVSERNCCENIRTSHRCFHLNFHGCNFAGSLKRLAASCRADVIEFQVKDRKYLNERHIESMKRLCRTGCLVHGEIHGIPTDVLNRLDYRVLISNRLCSIDYSRLGRHLISPNAISTRATTVWRYAGQKRALIVSRLRQDKIRQLQSAIEYCRSRGISFTIAGAPRDGRTAACLRKKYGLSDEEFTPGAIDTVEYLASHMGEYLFVAGVGQVLLEAGLLGFPCLVASDLGAAYCSFLTKENILREDVFGRNLTIGHFKDKLEEVQEKELILGRISDYDVSDVIRDEFSLEKRVAEYVAYIDTSYRDNKEKTE